MTAPSSRPLQGLRALVTSGPTHEAIDPVRYIGNRSSGKQGHAIAEALVHAGVIVTLVSGPVSIPDPDGVFHTEHVETAEQMLAACREALPADIVVCAAAVSDWRVRHVGTQKIKKRRGSAPPLLELEETPDILSTMTRSNPRPRLIIGFAAETEDVLENARVKREHKGCDWLVANDVSHGAVFGQDVNRVWLVTHDDVEQWPKMTKKLMAENLVERIAARFAQTKMEHTPHG